MTETRSITSQLFMLDRDPAQQSLAYPQSHVDPEGAYLGVFRPVVPEGPTAAAVVMQHTLIHVDIWNRGFNFVGVARHASISDKRLVDPTFLVVQLELSELLAKYQHLTIKDLRVISGVHDVSYKGSSKTSLHTALAAHRCCFPCHSTLYIFREAPRVRQARPWLQHVRTLEFPASSAAIKTGDIVDTGVTSSRLPVIDASATPGTRSSGADDPMAAEYPDDQTPRTTECPLNTTHLEPASQRKIDSIIREWQQEMDPKRFVRSVCAVCSALKSSDDLKSVHANDLPLSVLRNDDLPEKLRPDSYNFHAYGRALLDPCGLDDREEKGMMSVCRRCLKDLRKRQMPRLALCNWLYYARDRLPSDVRKAFAEMSIFEKAMICRVRTNSLVCKFTESGFEDDLAAPEWDPARRHIRGNLISIPLNVTQLNSVLPPPKDVIKDTICALFVGSTVPTMDNIKALKPVLVRKSRVRLLLRFLLENNPHYATSQGFRGYSAENLESLFGGGADVGVPQCVNISYLLRNDALDAPMADYSGRLDGHKGLSMENVSYTLGDYSEVSFDRMKMRAVHHCRTGRPFISSTGGSLPAPDISNPNWLSWAHPNAAPYGIGGFHHPRRSRHVSMEAQIKHLLGVRDPFFEKDPEIAFDVYNILRKKAVNDCLRFKVPFPAYRGIVSEILRMNKQSIVALQQRFDKNPNYKPNTQEELNILKVMASISPVVSNVQGGASRRIRMRNEIRAMISQRGSPTLFVTLNPADYCNPIVTVLAQRCRTEEDIVALSDLSRKQVSDISLQHPVACAEYFDRVVRAFCRSVLRCGRKDGAGGMSGGIFGVCDAYYGTVETQGHGSLHCHMLIWLNGHLAPETLSGVLRESEFYRRKLVVWLESIVESGFLGSRKHLNAVKKPTQDELRKIMEPHPASVQGPLISVSDPSTFRQEMREYVDDLLLHFNWHRHTSSCWKYLRPNESREDSKCRFGMDGVVRPETILDLESGTVSVKRDNAKMTHYNPVITLLLKSNNDVKFIGSGEEANAFMYYVTDYITKAPLSMYAGLGALAYALQQGESRGIFKAEGPEEVVGRKSMTVAVNSMLGRQEISHPQVMAYILGDGESYSSETFQAVNWGEILRFTLKTLALGESGPSPHQSQPTDFISMSVAREGSDVDVTASNQLLDYICRPNVQPFDGMNLYGHVAKTIKVSRVSRTPTRAAALSRCHTFISRRHPQFATHVLKLRSTPVVPVFLGPRITRRRGTEGECEQWSRDMCIMFRPWRHPSELKQQGETWTSAMDRFMPVISDEDRRVMTNMSLISEGKHARDKRPRENRATQARLLDPSGLDGLSSNLSGHPEFTEWDTSVFSLLDSSKRVQGDPGMIMERLEGLIGAESASAFEMCLPACDASTSSSAGSGPNESPSGGYPSGSDSTLGDNVPEESDDDGLPESHRDDDAGEDGDDSNSESSRDGDGYDADDTDDEEEDEDGDEDEDEDYVRSIVGEQMMYMLNCRSRRIQGESSTVGEFVTGGVHGEAGPVVPAVDVQVLKEGELRSREARLTSVSSIISEMCLGENPEQLRAFRILAHHIINGGPQLLMYVGGKGGTGKSYLIRAIVELFERMGRTDELRLGAPTGIAASLIGGSTIHSLLHIGIKTNRSTNRHLAVEWRKVRYLVLDEVSMVGATFMATISARLQLAKADFATECRKIFGGVNILFLGDFHQLAPPKQPSLFASRLVKNPTFVQTRNRVGVDALAGAYLWRKVDTVVMLEKSKRHAGDPTLGCILEHIRNNTCLKPDGRPAYVDGVSVVDHLRSRDITHIASTNPSELLQFRDAPVIVGSKILRDALNARLLVAHAARLNRPVHVYQSVDMVKRKVLPEEVSERLRDLPTTSGSEFLGALPLFVGMRVMITENISVPYKIVNGSEGTVVDVRYSTTDSGGRIADVVYVRIAGCHIDAPGLEEGVVPVFPASVSVAHPIQVGNVRARSFRRRQVPLVPAYSYTDYKSQGRTLERAIVDLTSARGQGVYVMLSRVTTLRGLLILRWFPSSKIVQRMSEELRVELRRLNGLNEATTRRYQSHQDGTLISPVADNSPSGDVAMGEAGHMDEAVGSDSDMDVDVVDRLNGVERDGGKEVEDVDMDRDTE